MFAPISKSVGAGIVTGMQQLQAAVDVVGLRRAETRGGRNLCRVDTAHRRIQRRVGARLDDDRHRQWPEAPFASVTVMVKV